MRKPSPNAQESPASPRGFGRSQGPDLPFTRCFAMLGVSETRHERIVSPHLSAPNPSPLPGVFAGEAGEIVDSLFVRGHNDGEPTIGSEHDGTRVVHMVKAQSVPDFVGDDALPKLVVDGRRGCPMALVPIFTQVEHDDTVSGGVVASGGEGVHVGNVDGSAHDSHTIRLFREPVGGVSGVLGAGAGRHGDPDRIGRQTAHVRERVALGIGWEGAFSSEFEFVGPVACLLPPFEGCVHLSQ